VLPYRNTLLFSINEILTRLLVPSETTAVQSINTLRTLQGQYASKHQGKFAPNFDELIKSVQLDEKFKGESPVVSGYIYKMTVQQSSKSQAAFYTITADPIIDEDSYTKSSLHYYFDSALGIIQYTKENRQATAGDPSI
jgi:hypothetical protein